MRLPPDHSGRHSENRVPLFFPFYPCGGPVWKSGPAYIPNMVLSIDRFGMERERGFYKRREENDL